MQPSKKAEELEQFHKSTFGFDRRELIQSNLCCPPPIGCGKPAANFKDELSRKEYSISGLCQTCQDAFFDSGEDEQEMAAPNPKVAPRPQPYVAGPDEYVIGSYQMICGSAEAESQTYRKVIDESGCVWLIANHEAAAENIYFHNPKDTKSDGFGGRTLSFPLEDGTIYEAKGPWHSSAGALFHSTGIDLQNTYRTFVVLSMERDQTNDGTYRTIMRGIIFKDERPMLGSFDRHKELEQQYPEAKFYYSETRGGSSGGPTATHRNTLSANQTKH